MIKIEKTDVYGWESAIRGMRNPMDSWDKSDSGRCVDVNCENCALNNTECMRTGDFDFVVGINDLKLMKTLSKAGNDHGKFMRYINVTMDITAPLYWWKEFDTYKVGTVANSCSTMHKIMSKEFTEDMFSFEKMYLVDLKQLIIADLNFLRARYLETKSKADWYCLIQALPSSFNQKRTIQLNYAVLKNMYHARKNHKLDEWREFCEWVESLPYAKELIVGE